MTYDPNKYRSTWSDDDDSDDAPQQHDNTPIPAGTYEATINAVTEREVRAGGDALSVWLDVAEGKHDGRRVFDWINLDLPQSPQASEIGQRTFRRLCRAAGFVDGPPAELEQLIGEYVKIRVIVRPARGQYTASNRVVAYLPMGTPAAGSGMPIPVSDTAAPAAAAAADTMIDHGDLPF